MDIVGTFNHLIPSDQLEDSLLLGQNLECEASDEFASSHNFTEDSLRNMLSDKDPMFGSACTQFHLLENDDANFQLSGSLAPDHDMNAPDFNQTPADGDETQSRFLRGRRKSGSQPPRKQTASRGRGRGGRRGGPFRGVSTQRSWEKSDETTTEEQASTSLAQPYSEKREALLSRRFSVQEVEPSMNPVVVLRRLTVTVGGFKIELLPGPSTFQALNLQDDSVVTDCNGVTLGETQAFEEHPAPEVVQELEVIEQEVADVPMDFGPCVNPNDVQHTNGAAETTVEATAVEAKDDDQNAENSSVGKPLKKKLKPDKSVARKPDKPKQSPSVIKNKPALVNAPDVQQSVQGSKHPKVHDKKIQKVSMEKHHLKSKPISGGLKQPSVSPGPKPSAEPQKGQTSPSVKANTQPSVPDSATVHRKPSSDAGKPVVNKHPQTVKKAPSQAPVQGKASQIAKDSSTEDEQEKSKVKKQDKLLQRQRSRSSRSISIEEPVLFVPDNAPVVKKASSEDDHPAAPENESVWDSNKQCTLCSKPHSNRFMVGCGRCDDWFHGDCVGLDLAKVKQMEKDDQEYVCLKCCAEEEDKNNTEHPDAPEKSTSNQKQGPEPSVTAGGIRPFRKDSGERRPSTDSAQKTELTMKHERKKAKISIPSSKKPSTGHIRRSVRDSLEDILVKRLKGSDLNISDEKPAEVAKATEKELFALFQGVEGKYKNKYRSLMFNLKDTKNNVLFKRVLRGEVSPRHLVRMSAEELASKELAAWRQRENRHTIEMIEKEQREVERRPVTKITHKGEIEIENQEPAKVPEAMTDYSPKAAEVSEEKISESKPESPKKAKDTTSLHKSHLFDLHCKICTGRMAPPVEEATTKVVKVATTVIRRQSTATDGDGQETKSISPSVAPSALVDDLSLRAMEEGLLNFPGYESRLESVSSKEDTAAFLAGLTSLWNGFVDMPAVARYLTKAYPVSGTLDHLIEDLPESIQVGGRISPHTVWDYVEKIRASGTKEICVIRFTPDTEEDEIAYTLLYAYFSSRRRYGVVANNRKQVKDMYLIPLGSSEKIPHQIVPFDGPGLEINRPNLLLGLIIRQRPKRDFGVILPSDVSKPPSFLMESKPQVDPIPKVAVTRNEDQDFLSTLGRINKKDSANPDNSPAEKSLLELENDKNVSLRFLPGVLTQPKSDAAVPADDKVQNTDDGTTGQPSDAANSGSLTPKTPTTPRLDRFIIKKKEPKPVQTQQEAPGSNPETCSEEKANAGEILRNLVLSLKDKPGDVSTEAFLSSISAPQSEMEPKVETKSDIVAPSTPTNQEADAVTLPAEAQNADPSEGPDSETSAETPVDPPIHESPSSTLKNTSHPEAQMLKEPNTTSTEPDASQSVTPESTTVLPSPPTQPPTEFKAVEDIQNITTIFSSGKNDGPKQSRPRLQNPKPFQNPTHGPPPTSFASYHTGAPEHGYHPVPVPPFPPQSNPVPFMSLHPQVPPPFGYPPAPPPPMIFPPHDPHRMHPPPWSQPIPPPVCFPQMPETHLGPPSSYMGSRFSDSVPQKSEKCTEMWDSRKDERDYHGRHQTKSEHHERDRHRSRSRSRSESRSRHRHKSRHSREDRHGEKRKDRHHGSHHRDKEGDRNKHRRDSEHEKHRRDSKDRHS